MKACGLIVEYNPLHNGHVHHINMAKKISHANCVIAIMSGSFLQRGEPAIIDKFHRTRMALEAGVDIVIELPFAYAVQSSNLFAKGAIQTLYQAGVSSVCFGSESGNIDNFITFYHLIKDNHHIYKAELKRLLNKGNSFPKANSIAYEKIGLTTDQMDLSKPNNILGLSYVKEILSQHLSIQPLTIERIHNEFHQEKITDSIASATSIRKEILIKAYLTEEIISTMPKESLQQLLDYKELATTWHSWECYFPLLHYKIITMSTSELAEINEVNEGLEYRIKDKIKLATSFNDLIQAVKTKRYTWTRLQRMFVHILTNTKKADLSQVKKDVSVPYIRVLGMTKTGREYLKKEKKRIDIPIIYQLHKNQHSLLTIEERASDVYYSILPMKIKSKLRQQELSPPIII